MGHSHTVEAENRNAPVLNAQLLDQYRGRKSNLLERLIGAFLQEAPGFFQNIRKADESCDFGELRLNAHALKSCSYNLGAERLSKICQDIESAAVERDSNRVRSSMTRIGSEWFEAEQALRTELYKITKTTIPQQQPAAAVESATDEDWELQ